jgi:hypothetical protein
MSVGSELWEINPMQGRPHTGSALTVVESSQCAEHVAPMTPYRELVVEHAADYATLVDDVGHALVAQQGDAALHVVLADDSALGVRNEVERQAVQLAESTVALRGVRADADQYRVLLVYGFVLVPEATRFDRSALGEVLYVEIKGDVLVAGEVRQMKKRSVVERGGEIGGWCADGEHREKDTLPRPLTMLCTLRSRGVWVMSGSRTPPPNPNLLPTRGKE